MNNSVEMLRATTDIINKRLEKTQFYHLLISLVKKIICLIIILVVIFTLFFGITIQSGESMYPRIRDGDMVLWYRINNKYNIGDVIVTEQDNKVYTARIVAVAGDKVDASSEGKLVVNGSIQYEEIFYDTFMENSKNEYPYKVPANSYFVLGDMRTGAKDSRDFGAVSKDDIKGKIITVLRHRGI